MSPSRRKPEARRAFYERLEPRLSTVPGAEHVAFTNSIPAFGVGRRPLEVDGRPAPKNDDAPTGGAVTISPGFFDVAGVSVVRGRAFTEADGSPGAENVVVNEQFVAEHFKNEDAIGKRIRFMQPAPQPGQPAATPAVWRTIVGIVPNVRHTNIQDADSVAVAYLPWRQETPGFATVIMRSSVAPDTLMAAVRKEVQVIDPDQPVFNLRTMERMMRNLMWPYRVFGSLFTIFAFIGLMLSAVGLYAVMAYAVTQRTQEIGVRMALGAQGNQVTWMVLKRGLFQLGLGLALGLAGGYFAGRALPSRILVRTTATESTSGSRLSWPTTTTGRSATAPGWRRGASVPSTW